MRKNLTESFPEKSHEEIIAIEEHQYRQRIADDGAEAEVRKQQRHEAENDCPDAVLWPVGEERAERLGAVRDETDGGFKARERHRGGEDEETGGAEVVLCDLRERCAAVLAGFKHAAALRAGDRDGDVDERHQKAAENARADGAPRHSGGIVHAEVTDDLHDDDAKRILGFTAQQTLDYLQSLYEKKLCTYPRTDSRFLTDDMDSAGLTLIYDWESK